MTKTLNGADEPEDNEEFTITSATISIGNISSSTIASNQLINTNVNSATNIIQPLLFGQWIEKTKDLQEQFYGHKFEDFTQEELEQWVRVNVLAAEDELHEALGEISWKPWASAHFFNREAFLGEIVDVLHFVGNLLAGAQITDRELNAAYLEKMERNRQRQREGYTGTNKCTGCKRAVDDITAHGGWIVDDDPDASTRWCNQCATPEDVANEEN